MTARNTAFTFKSKAVDAKAIGKELGVSYVLEGSIQREAARDDFVLHVEKTSDPFIETLGPNMTAGCGIDELHVYANPPGIERAIWLIVVAVEEA